MLSWKSPNAEWQSAKNKTMSSVGGVQKMKEIYSKIYEFLLETRAQTIIAKAAIVADKFVLEPAYSTGLIRPIQIKTILTGFGIGLACALLLIFFKGATRFYWDGVSKFLKLTLFTFL